MNREPRGFNTILAHAHYLRLVVFHFYHPFHCWVVSRLQSHIVYQIYSLSLTLCLSFTHSDRCYCRIIIHSLPHICRSLIFVSVLCIHWDNNAQVHHRISPHITPTHCEKHRRVWRLPWTQFSRFRKNATAPMTKCEQKVVYKNSSPSLCSCWFTREHAPLDYLLLRPFCPMFRLSSCRRVLKDDWKAHQKPRRRRQSGEDISTTDRQSIRCAIQRGSSSFLSYIPHSHSVSLFTKWICDSVSIGIPFLLCCWKLCILSRTRDCRRSISK